MLTTLFVCLIATALASRPTTDAPEVFTQHLQAFSGKVFADMEYRLSSLSTPAFHPMEHGNMTILCNCLNGGKTAEECCAENADICEADGSGSDNSTASEDSDDPCEVAPDAMCQMMTGTCEDFLNYLDEQSAESSSSMNGDDAMMAMVQSMCVDHTECIKEMMAATATAQETTACKESNQTKSGDDMDLEAIEHMCAIHPSGDPCMMVMMDMMHIANASHVSKYFGDCNMPDLTKTPESEAEATQMLEDMQKAMCCYIDTLGCCWSSFTAMMPEGDNSLEDALNQMGCTAPDALPCPSSLSTREYVEATFTLGGTGISEKDLKADLADSLGVAEEDIYLVVVEKDGATTVQVAVDVTSADDTKTDSVMTSTNDLKADQLTKVQASNPGTTVTVDETASKKEVGQSSTSSGSTVVAGIFTLLMMWV